MTAWLRLHHDARRDRKLRAVAMRSASPYGHVFGLWCMLLTEASAARPRGWINEQALPGIAEDLQFDVGQVITAVGEMAAERLLTGVVGGWYVRKWRERQGIKPDLTATERKRRQRQRQRGVVTPVTDVTPVTFTPLEHVTPCHGVTFQDPYIVSTTTPASALRRTTEVSLSISTEARAERRASAPKRGGIFGWLIGEGKRHA